MIILAGAVIGAIVGVMTAKKRGGARLDMAQYGAGYGIALALAGLILTIVIDRMAV
ncbi:MAG: hypothetical protein AAGF79_13515 [Pseudomonadota bacterium]